MRALHTWVQQRVTDYRRRRLFRTYKTQAEILVDTDDEYAVRLFAKLRAEDDGVLEVTDGEIEWLWPANADEIEPSPTLALHPE